MECSDIFRIGVLLLHTKPATEGERSDDNSPKEDIKSNYSDLTRMRQCCD